MRGLLEFIDKISKPPQFIVLILASAIVFGSVMWTLMALMTLTEGVGILDFDIGYSVQRVVDVLGSYGPEGHALYARIQLLDILNPALYSLVLAALTHRVLRGTGPEWLCLLPLLGGLGDYAENITLFKIVGDYPEISASVVSVSSTLSLVKNGLLVVGITPLAIGLLLMVLRKRR